MSNDFEIRWQNYFTALDELAKTIVSARERARELGTEYLNGSDRSTENFFWTNWDIASEQTKVFEAEDVFYRAHLALKPFLEDDSE